MSKTDRKGTIPSMRSAGLVFRTVIAIVLSLAYIGMYTIPVHAAEVELQLGGTGSTSWNESDIKPGFSGTKTVTARNNGTCSGTLYIWLSDNVSDEGLNPESETGNTAQPGELDLYLQLGLSATLPVNTNITLPTTIGNFPSSTSDAKYIKIGPLNPGVTTTITWNWALPPETGNDVQGDTLSFTINYTLEADPNCGGGGGGGGGGFDWNLSSIIGTPEVPGVVAEAGCSNISPGDMLDITIEVVNFGAYDADGVTLIYEIPKQLTVQSARGGEGVGSVEYAGNVIRASLQSIKSNKSKLIFVTIKVADSVLPHSSLHALLENAPLIINDQQRPCPPEMYMLDISNLNIQPTSMVFLPFLPLVGEIGDRVSVSSRVTNICPAWRYNVNVMIKGDICHTREVAYAQAVNGCDNYTVSLKIDDLTRQIKRICLAKGERQDIVFDTTNVMWQEWSFPGRLSSTWWVIPTGQYIVDVNGLQGQFSSELWINWLLILIILAIIAFIIWWITRKRRKKPLQTGYPAGQNQYGPNPQ